jgi:hypothetical protein
MGAFSWLTMPFGAHCSQRVIARGRCTIIGGSLALLASLVQQLPAQQDGARATPRKSAAEALAMRDRQWIKRSIADADIYVLGASRAELLLATLPGAVRRALDSDLAFLGESFSGPKLQIFVVGADYQLTPLIGGQSFGSSDPKEGTAFIVGNDSMPPALRHEIMHLLLWRLWGTDITPWLSEGVAARATGTCGGYGYSAIAAELGREGKLVRLETLFTNFNFAAEAGAINYMEAASLIDYIDRTFGRKRLRALWATDGRQELKPILGVDRATLERDWRADLARQKLSPPWSKVFAMIASHGCE